MAFLSATIAGTTTDLQSIAALVGYDGWGAAPLHYITSRGSLQNGETILDYRLDPRRGVLVFKFAENTLSGMYDKRRQILNIFAPQNEIILRFEMDYGTRCIRARTANGLTMPWAITQYAAQNLTIDLYCADPLFYDPTVQAITFSVGGGSGAGSIPMAVPTPIGSTIIDASTVIDYSGTADSYPDVIRITGPIDDCVITNETTGDVLDFTGDSIAAGDYYDIDCRYGYKTVFDNSGNNQVEKLTSNSDLATWRFAAASDGSGLLSNTISASGTGADSTTKIEFTYYNKYIGL